MDDELLKDVLDKFCTACNGTGRDAFSDGALWCAACNGTGTREAQLKKEKEDRDLDERLKKI